MILKLVSKLYPNCYSNHYVNVESELGKNNNIPKLTIRMGEMIEIEKEEERERKENRERDMDTWISRWILTDRERERERARERDYRFQMST